MLASINPQFVQADARRMKVKEARKRREERQILKKEEMLKVTVIYTFEFETDDVW